MNIKKKYQAYFHNDKTEDYLIRTSLSRLQLGGYGGRNNIFCSDGRANDNIEPWAQPFLRERGCVYGYGELFRVTAPPLPQLDNIEDSHRSWGEIQELIKYYYTQQFPQDNTCPIMCEFNTNYDRRLLTEKITLRKKVYDTWLNAFSMSLFGYERSPYYLIQRNGVDLSSRKRLNDGKLSSIAGDKTRHWVIIQPFRYKTSIVLTDHRLCIDPATQETEEGETEEGNTEEEKKKKKNPRYTNRNNCFIFKQLKCDQVDFDVMNLVSNIKPYQDNEIFENNLYPKNANITIYNSSLLLKNTYPFSTRNINIKKDDTTIRFKEFDFPAMFALFLDSSDDNGHLMSQPFNLISVELFLITTQYRRQYFNKRRDKSLDNYYREMKKKFVLTHGPTMVDPVALLLGLDKIKGPSINELRCELNPIEAPVDIDGFTKCVSEHVSDLDLHFLRPLIEFISRMSEDDVYIDDRKVILYLSGPAGTGKTALYRVLKHLGIPTEKKNSTKQAGSNGFYFEFKANTKILYIDEVRPCQFDSVMDIILNVSNEEGVNFEQKHKDSIRVTKKMGLIIGSNYCLDCMIKNVDPEALMPLKQRIENVQLGKHDCITKKWTRPYDLRNKVIKYYLGDDKKEIKKGKIREELLGHIKDKKEFTEIVRLKDSIFYLESTRGVDPMNKPFEYKLYTHSYIENHKIPNRDISTDFIAVGDIKQGERIIKCEIDIQDLYVKFQGIKMKFLRNQHGVIKIETQGTLQFIEKICTSSVSHPTAYHTSKLLGKIMELFHTGPCMVCMTRDANTDYFTYPDIEENTHSVWCYDCFRAAYYNATDQTWKMPVFDIIRTLFKFPKT